MTHRQIETDVLIVGSGPVGAAFARTLVEGGREVLMVDAGPQLSRRPGAHLKNGFAYQRNHERFGALVRAHLHPLAPAAPGPAEADAMISLEAGVATYAVGGMATHWTGVTPRHHPRVERADTLPAEEWDALYTDAEVLLGTRADLSEGAASHRAVLAALRAEYTELPDPYRVQHLPMAARRDPDHPALVHWSGADTVLGPLADGHPRFTLREQHLCRRLVREGPRIAWAEVEDLMTGQPLGVAADTVVVACGAVLTPQLLHASGLRPPALGRYLTEQPVGFCQVVLRDEVVGPAPFPDGDGDPNVWIPVSQERPWHCQVHRDLPYDGALPHPEVDDRLVVDLRWFGLVDPVRDNRVRFDDHARDAFGLPAPRFEFTLSAADRERQRRMVRDLRRAAGALGPYLPGSEPRFVLPTLPLHIAGTVRMGHDERTSVVDRDSRVWGVDNLVLGGNGLIPTGNASNPTLTSVATALRAARRLLGAADHTTGGRRADERTRLPVPR
ncbi:GMC oxidoreductase [Actinokineospora sp. PR83]|uniref:GMC oxidoreductase n=1 Tax=Actinokineospora sp. PR83 TaxID=2884908 RepID=UPI001F2C4E83|nr:GMC oxidoreductase [Actinokineospora sp. PR83]MCG8915761.1 GMC oxidoreductase [Actinokineospora sp. PR83]